MPSQKQSALLHDLWKIYRLVPSNRRLQLVFLLGLMISAALSEVFSLGAVIPFLGALTNVESLLIDPKFQFLWTAFNVQSASRAVVLVTVIFIAGVVVANTLRISTIYFQTQLAAKIANDVSCRVYKHTLLQPYSFHVRQNSSDLISIIVEDTRNLTLKILLPVLVLFTNSIIALSLIGALLMIDGRIAFTSALVLGGTYVVLYNLRRKVLEKNSRLITQSSQQQVKSVQEGLGGIREVLLGSEHSFFLSTYRKADRIYRQAQASNTVTGQVPRYLIEGLAMVLIALLALSLGRDGDFSQAVPVVGSLALGANRLLPAMQQSFSAVVKIQSARASLRRILTRLQLPLDKTLFHAAPQPLVMQKSLQLKNVWFRYKPTDDWTLRGINLTIAANSIVGFVGSTGSGKSTTVDLILGLLQPEIGDILVDGLPLQREYLRQWQSSVSHVPQDIYLADATISENIAFGMSKESIDWERVYTAGKMAQLDDFIQTLPEGYRTHIGERGVRLSGGQRQRIGLARALYRQASIIILDEATSALDNLTEKEVMKSIRRLKSKVTVILIAHRLSTVEKCDVIFNLEQGNVSALGSYNDLLQHSEDFRQLAMANR